MLAHAHARIVLQYLGCDKNIYLSAGSVCVNCLYRYSVLHRTYFSTLHVTIDHVMPRGKRCGALDRCFGPHQQSIPQLHSLASQVYKGKVERSTCGFELMRFIPQGFAQAHTALRGHLMSCASWIKCGINRLTWLMVMISW